MGTSTNAILAYGYDLGGGEDEWKVREVDEDGLLDLPWYSDEDMDIMDAATDVLRTAAGWVDGDYGAPGYFEQRQAIDDQVGVEIKDYCSGDYPMYLLSAKTITVRRGDAKLLDLAGLQAETDTYDERLRAACEVLGITPTQEKPAWILVSYCG